LSVRLNFRAWIASVCLLDILQSPRGSNAEAGILRQTDEVLGGISVNAEKVTDNLITLSTTCSGPLDDHQGSGLGTLSEFQMKCPRAYWQTA
jgi:hypothetical protein